MAKMLLKKFSSADETRPFKAHGYVDILNVEGGTVGRGVFEPGWKWSEDVKPLAGTKSCEAAHSGYVLSGSMHVVMDDGQEEEMGPGDYFVIPPGHDAWTVGDEPCVLLDFAGMSDYARQARGATSNVGTSQPGTR